MTLFSESNLVWSISSSKISEKQVISPSVEAEIYYLDMGLQITNMGLQLDFCNDIFFYRCSFYAIVNARSINYSSSLFVKYLLSI